MREPTMARGELLRKLFLSQRRQDDDAFRAVALEVIAEEEKKNNHRLAQDLMRILENGGPSFLRRPPATLTHNDVIPKDRERQTRLVDVWQPQRQIEDILLSKESAAIVARVLQEYRKAELLRMHGLQPSTKLLFCGPPGCGKTLCSEIIASELGLPLLYTRFDAIVSSYLGETAANLRKVFEYAASGRWVVLFDEFDAIGKARTDATEHGELKRVINSFLQMLDRFTAPSILIAATNHEQLLDPALWRRFDEIIMFRHPTLHEIRLLLTMKLRNFPREGFDLSAAASWLKGMSHADVERVCFDAIKAAILQGKDSVDQEAFGEAVKQQRARLAITNSATRRGDL
ncbi:MAG TPA: ATP-binding protein [Thermoanaerobaculia bacterium]|nr:ATP-binding protein [Thermoanaerobaculia bacterium]